MNPITDKVLNKIKQGHLKPKSKWLFQLRDGGQWVGFVFLALLTIAAFGLLWYFWSEGPWLHGGRAGFGLFFGRMPLLLLGLLIIAGAFALLDFQNTGRGYRYSLARIALILIVSVGIFGWSINYLGFSARLDSSLKNLPLYQDREAYMRDTWQQPEQGLIAGEMIEVNGKNFVLRDFEGRKWTVLADEALWRHNLVPSVGLQVKIIGTANNDSFSAKEVRPWMRNGGCQVEEGVGSCGMMNR